MRDFLDAILTFIEAETLTDEEFDSLEVEEETHNVENYEALKGILIARENVSDKPKRLKLYFIARGVDLSSGTATKPASSQIFIGAEL